MIRVFYDALNTGECSRAARLRPGYSDCGKVSEAKVRAIDRLLAEHDLTVVLLDLSYRKSGKAERFTGYVTLRRRQGTWVIENNLYRSRKNASNLSEYLNILARKGLRAVDLPAKADASPESVKPESATGKSPARSAPAAQILEFQANHEPVPQHIREEMRKYSFRPGCPVPLDDLSYVAVSYYGLDDRVHQGHLIVHETVASEVIEIFEELFRERFPMKSMRIIDEYHGSDIESMEDNNTSAFNCRAMTGNSGKYSIHSYGLAVDINPLLNPYLKNGKVLPKNAAEYVDRNRDVRGMIRKGDACYGAFKKRGWKWGGDWKSLKDYQHFEKPAAPSNKPGNAPAPK